MECPSCGHQESKVVDSRPYDGNKAIKRRRECLACGYRFSTFERLEEHPLIIIKADGSYESYDRQKLMRGILIACATRPVLCQPIHELIDVIDLDARTFPTPEAPSKKLSEKTLYRMALLAYAGHFRLASSYPNFLSGVEFFQCWPSMQ